MNASHHQNCGTHRSGDDINNFKIVVTLRKTPKFISTQQTSEQGGEIEMQTMLQREGEDDFETYVFSWQEKVFSQREFEMYQKLENCKSAIENKYHQDINKLINKTRSTKRLFSYIEVDEYVNENEINKKMTTAVEEKPSYLANAINDLRMRKIKKSDTGIIPKNNIVDYKPDRTDSQARHLLNSPTQTLVIMADLNDIDRLGSDATNEVVLCTIQASSAGIIFTNPNFTNGQHPLIVKSNNNVFQYTIDPVSEHTDVMKLEKRTVLDEMQQQRTSVIKNIVGTEFSMPEAGAFKIHLFGEIVSAYGFDANNLYVNYLLNLPENWMIDNENKLYGTTNSCYSKLEGMQETFYFSKLFSMELTLQNANITLETFHLPQLFLEVWSQDGWNRYRLEGCGHTNLPDTAGTYEMDVNTWCPISSNLKGRLYRFFLGSGSEAEGIAFSTSISNKDQQQPLSRLGLHAESTGTVKVKMNLVHQSLEYARHNGHQRLMKGVLKDFGSVAVDKTISNVLEAFQKSRESMLAAREKPLNSKSTATASGSSIRSQNGSNLRHRISSSSHSLSSFGTSTRQMDSSDTLICTSSEEAVLKPLRHPVPRKRTPVKVSRNDMPNFKIHESELSSSTMKTSTTKDSYEKFISSTSSSNQDHSSSVQLASAANSGNSHRVSAPRTLGVKQSLQKMLQSIENRKVTTESPSTRSVISDKVQTASTNSLPSSIIQSSTELPPPRPTRRQSKETISSTTSTLKSLPELQTRKYSTSDVTPSDKSETTELQKYFGQGSTTTRSSSAIEAISDNDSSSDYTDDNAHQEFSQTTKKQSESIELSSRTTIHEEGKQHDDTSSTSSYDDVKTDIKETSSQPIPTSRIEEKSKSFSDDTRFFSEPSFIRREMSAEKELSPVRVTATKFASDSATQGGYRPLLAKSKHISSDDASSSFQQEYETVPLKAIPHKISPPRPLARSKGKRQLIDKNSTEKETETDED